MLLGSSMSTSYSSAHPEVKLLQTKAQRARDALRKAREDKASLIDIKSLADSYVDKKNAMLKKQQELKQASLTQRVSQEPAAEVSSNPSNLKRMWDYLRSYKTDHAKSSLPTQLYSNASKDKRLWTNGPLTTLAKTWHQYRSTLGQDLIGHKESPHNEETAKTLHSRARGGGPNSRGQGCTPHPASRPVT